MQMTAALLSVLTVLVFGVLAGLALVRSRLDHDRRPAQWLAASFGIIALIGLTGLVIPERTADSGDVALLVGKATIFVLALFPYCLYRFATTFRPAPRWIEILTAALTLLVCSWTLLLPDLPLPGAEQTSWFALYANVFICHWVIVSSAVGILLWRGGQGKPGLVRRRLRMLAAGAQLMAVALIGAGLAGSVHELAIVTQILGLASGLAFFAGYMPPPWLRLLWRRDAQSRLRHATAGIIHADSRREIAREVLPDLVQAVGGSAGVLVGHADDVRACWQMSEAEAEQWAQRARSMQDVQPSGNGRGRVMRFEHESGWLLVFTDTFTPFFGSDEDGLVRSILAIMNMGKQRMGQIENERESLRRLTELDRMKSDFVAMVAHDLRNPINVVKGFADLLREREDLTDSQRSQFLETIGDAADSLAKLVEDVQQVTRMDAGSFTYETKPLDALTLVERAAAEQRTVHPERKITVAADRGLPQVMGDPERLLQVIGNLVSNAIKFSSPDRPVAIEVRAGLDGESDFVRCSVTDQGMGIAPEDVPRLFQRFSRISPPDGRPKVAGTGLGLYISRQIVEALGGSINVESTPGSGSTFSFTMPVAVAPSTDHSAAEGKANGASA
jgi:signal transduction histidine kinase